MEMRIRGFDHGAGHPLLFLDDAKAPNYQKNNGFSDLGNYSEWPKVAGAVIQTDIVRHGKTCQGKQRYRCREKGCAGRSFLLEYAYGAPHHLFFQDRAHARSGHWVVHQSL